MHCRLHNNLKFKSIQRQSKQHDYHNYYGKEMQTMLLMVTVHKLVVWIGEKVHLGEQRCDMIQNMSVSHNTIDLLQ